MSAGVSDQRMKGQGNQVEQGMQNIGLEVNPSTQSAQHKDMPTSANSISGINLSKKSDHPKETTPKTMTWATVASQPAKPPVRTNSQTSTLKKKGPGMPPPPMVPGKHNMDIGTWDSPSKNTPPLIPPPIPAPIITPPSVPIESSAPPSQIQNKTQHLTPTSSSSNPQHPQQIHNQQNRQPMDTQQSQQSGSGSNPNSNNNNNGPMNNTNNRSNWSNSNDNRRSGGNHPNHMMPHNHHQIPHYHLQQQLHPQHQHQGPHHPHPGHHGQSPYQQQQLSHHQPYNQRHHQMQGPPPTLQPPLQPTSSQQVINNQSGSGTVACDGSESYESLLPQLSSLQIQQQEYQFSQRGLQSPESNCSSNGSHPLLEKLRDKNNYNPKELDMEIAKNARFFVIKSYLEDDIHRSIKYEIWCSTDHGNKRLDQAYREISKENGDIYLFFSVNGSGHFCGIAKMMSAVDYNSNSTVWTQDKWKGVFKVRWIYVKDIPNTQLRHIRLENNDNKSVTNSRDAQEVPNAKGQQVLKLIHSYKHTTSIFDDFTHYEKKQEEKDSVKDSPGAISGTEEPECLPNLGPPGPSGTVKQNNFDNSSGGSGNNPPRPHYSNYDKPNHYNNSNGGGMGGGGGNSYEKYGTYSGKNYGYENRNQYNNHRPSGSYNYNYDNRREDRGSGYDRKDSHDGGNSSSGYYNRENDFHHNKTHRNSMGNLERNDYRDQRRDDNRSYNNRDRDQDGSSGGGGGAYSNRGGHRHNYRDRGEHHGGGARGGRGGNSESGRGGNNNGVYRN